MGCPIDLVCNKGAGSSLLQRPGKMADVVRAASRCLSVPLTFKTRKVRWWWTSTAFLRAGEGLHPASCMLTPRTCNTAIRIVACRRTLCAVANAAWSRCLAHSSDPSVGHCQPLNGQRIGHVDLRPAGILRWKGRGARPAATGGGLGRGRRHTARPHPPAAVSLQTHQPSDTAGKLHCTAIAAAGPAGTRTARQQAMFRLQFGTC